MAVSENKIKAWSLFLFLVSILTQTLLSLVCSHLMTLAFFTAWHNIMF